MQNRTSYMVLGAVALLTLLLLKLPDRATGRLKLAVSSLFMPLFGLVGSMPAGGERAARGQLASPAVEQRLVALAQENKELRLQVQQAEAIARENQRLRRHLALPQTLPSPRKLARVVGRDPANWWRLIKIDAGARDRVSLHAPVFTAEGLVGRVIAVGIAQADVLLVGDPDCRVSVLVEETRDHGILGPASSRSVDDTLVDLSYLSRGSELKTGQAVVTSGYGGVYPKGLVVGHIVDFRSADFGLHTQARVRLAVNLGKLEEVWVKLP
jgi:rod shape-determining protein MreC